MTERVEHKVPVQVCRYVAEERVRKVPVTVCRMVEEERVEPYQVRVCKIVAQKETVQVPRGDQEGARDLHRPRAEDRDTAGADRRRALLQHMRRLVVC